MMNDLGDWLGVGGGGGWGTAWGPSVTKAPPTVRDESAAWAGGREMDGGMREGGEGSVERGIARCLQQQFHERSQNEPIHHQPPSSVQDRPSWALFPGQ